MPRPSPITAPKQLLVEGRDAEVFFHAMLNHLVMTGIQLQNFGGNNELRGFLKALVLAPNFSAQVTSVGILRDAETNPSAAFQSVRSALASAHLPVPARALEQVGNDPRVKVSILPDPTTEGMLETLCLQSVANDPAMACVEHYLICVEQVVDTPPNNMPKAQLQAFLASRPRPGLLLGQVAYAGYWPWNRHAFSHVKQFLQTL